MKLNLLSLLIVLLSLANCTRKASVEELETIAIYPDSLIQIDKFLQNIQIKDIDNQVVAYWINYATNSFHTFNFATNEKIDIAIDSSIVKSIYNRIDYQLLNKNEVGFYSWFHKKFFILNIRNHSIKKYDFTECLNKSDRHLSPLSTKQFPFIYTNNTVNFVCTYTDLLLDNMKTIKQYLSRKNTVNFTLSEKGCSYYTFGHFPMNYRNGHDYNDYYFYSCTNNSEQLIYSFSANDSIYIYSENGKFIKQYEAKSKYSKKFVEFDSSKITDFNYQRQYAFSNPFYRNIVYDKHRKLYYRLYKKANSYLNDEGKIRKPSELEWSVIILDSEFNKINEIDLNPTKYSVSFLIPTAKGVYIGHPYEENLKNKCLSLTLLKLNHDFE